MNFKTFFFSLFFFYSCLTYCQNNAIDVLHYKYDLSLTDSSDLIHVIATIRFKPIQSMNQVSFDLTGINNSKKGMVVQKITGNGKPISFSHRDNKIVLSFDGALKANEESEIQVEYSGIPSDGLIISKNKYRNRTFFSDNWPDRAHNWLPCKDEPGDKASVEFIITAPDHYQVISNGIKVEETNLSNDRKLTHWKEDVPLATKIMVIGVAAFAVNLAGEVNGIPVFSWVFPEEKEKGFYDYALAKDPLSYFMNYIGPYGYKKLANVQSKTIFGGMENANAIFYSENSINGKRTSETLLAHEIAHQWFGDMATEKSFPHVWLSEGFATYMTIMYMENKYGKDTAVKMLKEDRKQVEVFAKRDDRSIVDSTTKNYMDLLNVNSYQKGGWVLHMLRRQLGDSLFRKAIRTYYSAYAGKNADTDDLRKIFEQVSGKDLKTFFQQWLYMPGVPGLEVMWWLDGKTKKMNISVNQLQKNAVFKFPLEIVLQSSSGSSRTEKLNITKQKETFIFSANEKPQRITLDPNTSLLFYGTVAEAKQ